MREQLLFVVAPRLAALCCLVGAVIAYLVRRRTSDPLRPAATAAAAESSDAIATFRRCSIAVVLVGHVLAFAFPGAVTLWNRQLLRLILLECAAVTVGTIALLSLGLSVARRRAPIRSSVDIIASTLIFLEVLSGLIIAVRYRWASSWAEVTLTPYLHSLLAPTPSVVLVARMPFLVQLHVFCAFAILAIVPVTSMSGPLIASAGELARLAITLLLRLYRPAWRARGEAAGE
jgi:nitrate reductase gamma subunit